MTGFWIVASGLNGLVAVAVGAVASHVVAGDARAIAWLTLGAQYQTVHALALLGVAALGRGDGTAPRLLACAGAAFLVGCLLFSGGLYVLALAPPGLGAVVPIGGTAFMVGWLLLAAYGIAVARAKRS